MKSQIDTKKAPAAIGPYSQGIKWGQWVFTSGQLPMDPKTKELVDGGIKEQTEQVLENIQGVLEASGGSMREVVKVTVFLDDMDDFDDMNEVYSEYFDEDPPARSCVQVARLPKEVKIEAESIAILED